MKNAALCRGVFYCHMFEQRTIPQLFPVLLQGSG